MKSYNYSKFTEYYVLIITCFVPLFFLPFSKIDAFIIPKTGLWTASLITTILLMLAERMKTKEPLNLNFKSNINILLCIYIFIWFISTLFSVDKIVSITGVPLFNGLTQLLMSIITFLLITNYFQFKLSYMKYILLVYSIIAVYCIVQFYKIDPFAQYYGINIQEYLGQTFATIGNQNQVATCLSVVYIVAAFLFIIVDDEPKKKYLYFITSLIIFAGGITTSSRAGWLAIACVYLIALPYVIKHRTYLKRYITICFACVIIFIVIDITSDGVVVNRMMSIFIESSKAITGEMNNELGSRRMEIWLNSIDLIRRYWLIGSGPETFVIIYNNLGLSAQNNIQEITAISPHNESLRLIITTGIFSLLTYWVIVLSIIKIGIKKIKENKYIIPFLLGLVCYLIKGMLNCSVITDMIIFWVLLALIYSYEKPESIF